MLGDLSVYKHMYTITYLMDPQCRLPERRSLHQNPWISVQGAAAPMLIAISHRIPHYTYPTWVRYLVSRYPTSPSGAKPPSMPYLTGLSSFRFDFLHRLVFSQPSQASNLPLQSHSLTFDFGRPLFHQPKQVSSQPEQPCASVRSFHHHPTPTSAKKKPSQVFSRCVP